MKRFYKKINIKGIIGYGCAIFLGACVSFAILQILTPAPYSPLSSYPEQQILTLFNETTQSSESNNIIIPIVDINTNYVFSQGTKCSSANTRVVGTFTWRSTIPGGFSHKLKETFKEERIKGCQTFTYQNKIPKEVYDWAKGVIDNGQQPELYMSGCETPIDKNGKEGTQVCWRSEPFAFKV